MIPVTDQPSLRRRVDGRMLFRRAALALALGLGGALVIRDVVETTHDRLLDGSVLAIAERLGMDEDNEVTVDLPRVALGMLESQAQDRIYYRVSYDGSLVTGYRDLPEVEGRALRPGEVRHWDATMRGAPVRVAAQARWIYGKPEPVVVEVAETRDGRRALHRGLLADLAGLEAGLLGLMGALAWYAIGRGLAPLTRLSAEIASRAAPGAINLQPLDPGSVPREALAPVQAMNVLLERLSQSMGAVRRFTADASHQIRTPLAAARMHLELIRRHYARLPIPPEVGAALDDAQGATWRLENLVRQLLVLARADEQAGEAVPLAPMDLAETVAEIVAERVPHALERGIEIQFERRDETVPILGDPLLAGEIIANLIDNAIRYNRRGGMVIVRVASAPSGGARAEVEDDGPGIPPDERAKAFERFHRITRPGGPEGSGLGLAIVRTLADRIGAAVTLADPTSGTGLLATIVFAPAIYPAEEAAGGVAPALREAHAALHKSRRAS